MTKITRMLIAACVALGVSGTSAAAGFNDKNVYAGGGLGFNSASGLDSGIGYQFFGGYSFGVVSPRLNLDAEVGYMDTGNMKKTVCFLGTCASASAKAKGLWSTAVARYELSSKIELIGRAGLDFGDDDGFMFGVGLGFPMSRQLSLRGEYVVRQHIDSLQFNAAYRFQ